MPASAPPATITSASSRRMISLASPRAWPPVAHADTVVKLGPVIPNWMAIWPARDVDGEAVDEGPDPAQTGPQDHAGPLGKLTLEALGETGLVERLPGCD